MSKNYQGNEVVEYKQTPGKVYCLNPALERHLPEGDGKKILDVGCGDGFYADMCNKKNYEYYGVDLSQDMVDKARSNFPNNNFVQGSCFELSKLFKENSFEVVISSMLFPEFENIELFRKALSEIRMVLNIGGTFLLGTAHPSFDMYLRKYLLKSENVETDFYSYYDSGKTFKVRSKNMGVVFEDHHWTFEDYVNELIKEGFEISQIDECKVIDRAKEIESAEFYEERVKLPSYILFKARNKNS